MPDTESQDAVFPNDMLRIPPPKGTILSEARYDREKRVEINRFGLVNMAHGKIRTFDEKPDELEEYADGTFLYFQPGNFGVHIIRRNLTAPEINEIGRLSMGMDNAYRMLEFLPHALEQTNELINGLRMMASAQFEIQPSVEEVDAQTEQEVGELGTIRNRMLEKQGEISTKLDSMFLELNDLGVTLILNKTGSTRDGAIPVKLQADKVRGKQESQSAK